MQDGNDSKTASPSTWLDLLRKPQEGYSTTIEVAQAIGGKKGGSLEIVRRQLQPEPPQPPERSESRKRAHEFYAVSGFLAYLAKFGSTGTVVFADTAKRCVQAVLNENSKQGKEVVALRPQVHPRWQPWRDLIGQRLAMESFLGHVRQNRKAVVEPDGRQLIFQLSQITCATEVSLRVGSASGGNQAVNGLVITTKIQGKGQSDPVALPESIAVQTPVWVDEDEQRIEMDLVLGAKKDGTEVWCQLASADIREAEIVAFDALVGKLRTELDPNKNTVTHGSFAEADWSYLRRA